MTRIAELFDCFAIMHIINSNVKVQANKLAFFQTRTLTCNQYLILNVLTPAERHQISASHYYYFPACLWPCGCNYQ